MSGWRGDGGAGVEVVHSPWYPTSARPLCSISCTQWTTIAGARGMHVGQKEAWSSSCSVGVWSVRGSGL